MDECFFMSCEFAPFADWFVLRQRLAVDGRGCGRTDGRAAGGGAHVLPTGLGKGAGLRLPCDAAGTIGEAAIVSPEDNEAKG